MYIHDCTLTSASSSPSSFHQLTQAKSHSTFLGQVTCLPLWDKPSSASPNLYPVAYLANLTMEWLAIGQSRTNLLSFTYQIGTNPIFLFLQYQVYLPHTFVCNGKFVWSLKVNKKSYFQHLLVHSCSRRSFCSRKIRFPACLGLAVLQLFSPCLLLNCIVKITAP